MTPHPHTLPNGPCPGARTFGITVRNCVRCGALLNNLLNNSTNSTQETTMGPTIHRIRKSAGIAGQFSVTADVEYPDEPKRSVVFVGSSYGGPVVMQSGPMETFVTDPSRFGDFGEQWVRRFFADA